MRVVKRSGDSTEMLFDKVTQRIQKLNMAPEFVIRYIIGDTIKQAEMYEFERWSKVEGCPIFHSMERK